MFQMMKCRIRILVTVAALIGLATSQNAKVGLSSAASAQDPLKTATKPLTPKSAIQPRSRSSAPLPNASTNSRKTNAELARLERQSTKTGGSKGGNTGAAKAASIKPLGNPSKSGSGINSSYQKPHIPQKK